MRESPSVSSTIPVNYFSLNFTRKLEIFHLSAQKRIKIGHQLCSKFGKIYYFDLENIQEVIRCAKKSQNQETDTRKRKEAE